MSWDEKYRAAADRVRAKDEAETRGATEAARRAAQVAHLNRHLMEKVDREVVQPFLRAADSPEGEAASRILTRSEKRFIGGYKECSSVVNGRSN